MTNDFEKDVNAAVEVLNQGGIIAYPTDTIWGIGCDATCQEAVEKIFDIKGRSHGKGIIALVSSPAMAQQVTGMVIPATLGDRPTTIIFPHVNLAPSMLAPDGSGAIRISDESYSKALCEKLGKPIASTSANLSGEPSPQTFDEISPLVLDKMDYVAQHGRNYPKASPSRIVKVEDNGELKIIRE